MSHEEMQLCWDQHLINCWRRFEPLWMPIVRWEEQTGQKIYQLERPLKRVPAIGHPRNIGVRVFVAEMLPKISDRLWNQGPERDGALIEKLQGSKYDTLERRMPNQSQRDMANLGRKIKNASARLQADRVVSQIRQKDGDWGTTKSNPNRRKLRLR